MLSRNWRILVLLLCAVLLLTAAACDDCRFTVSKKRRCQPIADIEPCKCTKEGYCPPCAPPPPEDDKPSPTKLRAR